MESRASFAKHVSNTAGFTEPPGAQLFQDVPPGHAYYDFIWRLGNRGLMVGFPCGGIGEPCVGPANLPYFRPDAPLGSVTRMEYARHIVDTFFPGCASGGGTPTP